MVGVRRTQGIEDVGCVEVTAIGRKRTWFCAAFRFFHHRTNLHSFPSIFRIDDPVSLKFILRQLLNGQYRIPTSFPSIDQLLSQGRITKNNIIRIGDHEWFIVDEGFNEHQRIASTHHVLLAHCEDVGRGRFDQFQFFMLMGFFKGRREFDFPVKIIFKNFFPP